MIGNPRFHRFSLVAINALVSMTCCAVLTACPEKGACVFSNAAHLQVQNARIPQVVAVTAEGPCDVSSSSSPCEAGTCLYNSGEGTSSEYLVTGSAPGTCVVTVEYSDGSPTEQAKFLFVTGPVQYCCEALCTKTVVLQSRIPD